MIYFICVVVLLECVDFNDVRNKHFVASSVKDLFDNVEAQNSIDFIKETRFISNFNVFILMFVICFFYSRLIALSYIHRFTSLLIISISDQSYKP